MAKEKTEEPKKLSKEQRFDKIKEKWDESAAHATEIKAIDKAFAEIQAELNRLHQRKKELQDKIVGRAEEIQNLTAE